MNKYMVMKYITLFVSVLLFLLSLLLLIINYGKLQFVEIEVRIYEMQKLIYLLGVSIFILIIHCILPWSKPAKK
jgi:ABC-type transport system involved in multi-copper enzyme maturation permease subunit